jgi:hypothetical protein
MKNLVVVNLWNRLPACGALLTPDGFDLAIINPTNNPYLGSKTFELWQPGYKFPNLAALASNHVEVFDYDYVWVVDDDVRVEGRAARLFEIMRAQGLDLAQPALTHHSHWSHRVTLQYPGSRYRLTSFVEIMAPCFSREAFRLCYPTFTETCSGWGLDWVWPKLLMDLRGRPTCAIVDEMTHTLPTTSRNWILPNGKRPEQEMREMLAKYNTPRTIVYGCAQ